MSGKWSVLQESINIYPNPALNVGIISKELGNAALMAEPAAPEIFPAPGKQDGDAGTAAGPKKNQTKIKKRCGIIQSLPWPWQGHQAAPNPRDVGTATAGARDVQGHGEGGMCPGERHWGHGSATELWDCLGWKSHRDHGVQPFPALPRPSETTESNHPNHSQHCQDPHGISEVGKRRKTIKSKHPNHFQHCQSPNGITGVGKTPQAHGIQPFPALPRPSWNY